MLNSLIVSNLRSFKDRHEFQLRPITVFLGRNSSGKSTITRLIPLYQQSFEQRISAPILWNGLSVDFGSITDARPRNQRDAQIGLGFSFETADLKRAVSRRFEAVRSNILINDQPITYEVGLTEQADTSDYVRTRLCRLELRINDDYLLIEIDEAGRATKCLINEIDFSEEVVRSGTRLEGRSFFPHIRTNRIKELHTDAFVVSLDLIEEEKFNIVSSLSHGITTEQNRRVTALKLPYGDQKMFFDFIATSNIGTQYFKEQVSRAARYFPDKIERLRQLCLLASLTRLITAIENVATEEFLASSYVGPTRAAGERYYRWQELAVDRLDPKGENFAMYVMSLTPRERARFSELFQQHFGYSIKASRDSGHASIMLAEAGGQEWFNLADMGFGFSQILPVIAQLHAVRYANLAARRRPTLPRMSRSSVLLAVEQPELHLHPAFQSRIADLFASVVSSDKSSEEPPGTNFGARFVIETHSEAIVNRLSSLIAEGRLKTDDAVIYVFEKRDGQDETRVRRVNFTPGGEMKEWPYGFFQY